MTFSVLAVDQKTGEIGGAASTGSLCVGGWVLRAHPLAGASASQGAAPSTFWGDDALILMRNGIAPRDAVASLTEADSGRAARQLAALDRSGQVAAFTGDENGPVRGERLGEGLVVTGNLLADDSVLDAIFDGFTAARGPLPQRLLAAIQAGAAAGGDSRGMLSAALLVVGPDKPPLSLRIDYSQTPIDDLAALLERAQSGDYAEWLDRVPVLNDLERR